MGSEREQEQPTLKDCGKCYGEGWFWDEKIKSERPCNKCDGLGFVRDHLPTERTE